MNRSVESVCERVQSRDRQSLAELERFQVWPELTIMNITNIPFIESETSETERASLQKKDDIWCAF
jgi:hypothetical protein